MGKTLTNIFKTNYCRYFVNTYIRGFGINNFCYGIIRITSFRAKKPDKKRILMWNIPVVTMRSPCYYLIK